MAGYWKDPQATEKMLKPGPLPGDRVLCTQDWFTMDADGFFYFKGRSDDIIKTRGEKVSPVEIENVLYGITGVKDAAVIGKPDEHLGQTIKAFVVLENGVEISAAEVRKYCSTKLENFMVPQSIEFVKSLPKTSTGKISKKELL
jgi:acyl-coenzyme A synthetase/AMP-(fatty) acid ligase